MPRGAEGIAAAKRDIDERKAQGGGGGLWFKLSDGEEATVRFLESGEDLAFAWCHEVSQVDQKWPKLIVCRDQDRTGEPCPGCEKQLKRRFRGWVNIIWRNAPVRATDDEGKWVKEGGQFVIEGHEDQNAIWNAGIEVFETLVALDGHYKGLPNRDYTVKRTGELLNTKWTVMPEDPSPMSKNDKELAENKSDLDRYITPQSYEDWGSNPTQRQDGDSSTVGQIANPFPKRS